MKEIIVIVLQIACLLVGLYELYKFVKTHDLKTLTKGIIGLLLFVVGHGIIEKILSLL